MSVLNTSLQTIVVRLRDITGNVTRQKLHNRVFDAYEAKALVFEAITPAQQQAMAQYQQQQGKNSSSNYGIVPPQHPAGQPILIDNWNDLLAIHDDNNLYRLLPRCAKSNQAYLLMQGICASAGSPFTMDQRVDPLDYKMIFRDKDIDLRNNFNLKNAEKLTTHIWFDGILTSQADTGLVMAFPSITPSHVNNMAAALAFLREWVLEASEGDRHRQLRQGYTRLLNLRTHLFIGTQSLPSREMINYAKSKSVYIYGKKDNKYIYQV